MNNNQQPLFVTNHNNTFGSQVPEEAGIYNIYVSPQSKAGNSKNGNPMASMDYIVLDGTQKGKHIFDRLVWTNNTQENHDLSVKRFNTQLQLDTKITNLFTQFLILCKKWLNKN